MKKIGLTLVVLSVTLFMAGTAQAGTIGVNFADPGTDGTSWPAGGDNVLRVGTGLEPDESLGAVAQSNWNNQDYPDGNTIGLFDWDAATSTYSASDPQQYIDSTGSATDLSVSYGSFGGKTASTYDSSTSLGRMFWGVWQAGGTATIGLSGVPYDTYDVIVYIVEPGAHGGNHVVSASDGTTTYYIDPTDGSAALAESSYANEDDVTGEQNYVTFTGLTGDTTITVDDNGNTWKAGVAGFQIVPEPATMALLGLGGLGLLLSRRRI